MRFFLFIACACGGPQKSVVDAAPDVAETSPAQIVDWEIALDPNGAGPLSPALLGEYDLSGALYRYDLQSKLAPMMKTAGFGEWRVGVGRWEFGSQLLPALTDATPCDLSLLPAAAAAPQGTTDLDLIKARDWFTYTDGAPVTMNMTADDNRYMLTYVRSVIDVATALGAEAYVDIDHMPRALAANPTPVRTNAEWPDACMITWTNKVSNVRPADPSVFSAAATGLVRRVVEGSGGEPARAVRYWEFWNEPELAYAWNPNVGDLTSYAQTAAAVLIFLDAYRKQTSNANGKAIRIGLGSFANAATAATILTSFPAPFDFVSFHEESDDDPLAMIAHIKSVADARKNSSHPNAELVLAEWWASLDKTKLGAMGLALHHATVLALGAAAGLSRAHHAIFWDYFGAGLPGLGILNYDFSAKPVFWAFALFAEIVGGTRLAPVAYPDGQLDGGMGAVIAAKDGAGKVRVLFVNRNASSRTASVGAMPATVKVLDDPSSAPHAVAPSNVIVIPARSIVLVTT